MESSASAHSLDVEWGGCVIEPRKGSIEVGGSLWYNGLVFALCQAIPVAAVARTRNEAMADACFPKRPLARELLLLLKQVHTVSFSTLNSDNISN